MRALTTDIANIAQISGRCAATLGAQDAPMDMKVTPIAHHRAILRRQPRIRAHDPRHRIHRARIPAPAEARRTSRAMSACRNFISTACSGAGPASRRNNISPRSRAARPAHALQDEPSVMDAAHSVGLSGGGRLHDLTVTLEAMTPGEIRAGGEGVRSATAWPPRHSARPSSRRHRAGLCRLPSSTWFSGGGTTNCRPCASCGRGPISSAMTRAQQHWWPSSGVRGRSQASNFPLAVIGTNFQVQVWRALLELDPGETVTYGALARKLGKPDGARAVGNAVGANPIAWVIPCHRVCKREGTRRLSLGTGPQTNDSPLGRKARRGVISLIPLVCRLVSGAILAIRQRRRRTRCRSREILLPRSVLLSP